MRLTLFQNQSLTRDDYKLIKQLENDRISEFSNSDISRIISDIDN